MQHVLGALLLTSTLAGVVVMKFGGPEQEPEPTPYWLSHRMVVAEHADGTFDVIGRSRRVGRDVDDVRLIALDGRTGTPRWESATIGTYISTDEAFVTTAGDLALFTRESTIEAFALADGSRRWTVTLPARIEHLCDHGDTILSIGVDGMGVAIVKRDGTQSAGTPAVPCPTLPTDARGPRRRDDAWVASEKHGMLIDDVYPGASVRVLAGRSNKHLGRSLGSGIATLAAVDLSGGARWRVELPEVPQAAPQHPPIAVVVGSREVCAAYEVRTRSRPVGVACFAIADGERRWSDLINDWNVSALVITGRTLLLAKSGAVEARDLETGVIQWEFGDY